MPKLNFGAGGRLLASRPKGVTFGTRRDCREALDRSRGQQGQHVLIDDLELFEPTQEEMRRSVRLLHAPRALEGVQHFVAPIHPGASLLLTRECHRILDVANDASVHEVELGREVELDRHAITNWGPGSKFRESVAAYGPRQLGTWRRRPN